MIQYLLVERYSIECQRFYGWKSTWSSTESLEGENDIVFLYVVQFHKEINQVGYHLPSNRVYHLYLDDHHPWPGSFPNQWSWPVLCWCILLLQRSPAATVVISFSVAFLGALQIFGWKRNEWELKKSRYTDFLLITHVALIFVSHNFEPWATTVYVNEIKSKWDQEYNLKCSKSEFTATIAQW